MFFPAAFPITNIVSETFYMRRLSTHRTVYTPAV